MPYLNRPGQPRLYYDVADYRGKKRCIDHGAEISRDRGAEDHEAAEREIDALKALVTACRTLRSEMNIPPAKKLPLIVQGDARRLEAYTTYLQALVRLSDVIIVDSCRTSTRRWRSPAISGRYSNRDQRRRRARAPDEEEDRLTGEIAKAGAKLANPKFIERASAAVVEQEMRRLDAFRSALGEVRAQLSRLPPER